MTYKNNDDDAAFFDDEEEEECRVCRGPAEDGYVTSHFRMKKKNCDRSVFSPVLFELLGMSLFILFHT
jgi:hypothetical protein